MQTKLLIFFSAVTLAAQQNPPPVDNLASVQGTVTNAVTGEPLLRAHVTLTGYTNGANQTFGALTAADGKFSITGMPAGSYMARADRVGFTGTADRTGRNGTQVNVGPGDKKDDLKLKLTPAGAISGRVVDADGEPVESVTVEAQSNGPGMRFNVSTDAKGQFRVSGLAPRKYRVKASPMHMPIPPEIRTDGTTEANDIATFYPNSPDEKGATRIQVQPGTEVSAVEVRLARAPIVRISGRVTGMPPGAEHTMIELRRPNGFGSGGQVKPDGTFQIWRVEPGKYSISAQWRGNGQWLRSGSVDVEVAGSNVDNVELRMIPPSDIAGQVEFADEDAKHPPALQQRQGQQQTPPPPRQLSLWAAGFGQPPRPVEIGEDGSFRLLQVQPGRYRVRISGGAVYVKSMRLGQTPMESDVLDLNNGSGGAPLTLLVASATGEISGTVNDDKGPAPHVLVALVAEDAEDWTPPQYGITGDDGAYRFTGLAPGKYKLAAIDESDRGARLAILDDYEDVLQQVEVRDGDKVTRDLKRGARPSSPQ